MANRDNSMKHTPGPWIRKTSSTGVSVHVGPDGKPFIAKMDNIHTYGRDVIEANARLIAAAPDMLEALQEAVRWDTVSGLDNEWPLIIDQIKSAIAKAEGKP